MADINIARLNDIAGFLEQHGLDEGGYSDLTRAEFKADADLLRSLASQLPALLSSRSDAERLDWLTDNQAHVEEFPNKGEFQVVLSNEHGEDTAVAQRSKSSREAIDKAINELATTRRI